MGTLSGVVVDENGTALPGASVYSTSINKGVSTNASGKFSIILTLGQQKLIISYLGYQTIDTTISLSTNATVNFQLQSTSISGEEITVTSQSKFDNIQALQPGSVKLKTEDLKSLPQFFGETDVVKAIQLMPGVQSVNEGSAGLYVRGGGPGDNLILLDNINLYNPSHLMGIFSVFSSEVVSDISLIKGGMPSEYGGRQSSVLEASLKTGDMYNHEIKGSTGLMNTQIMASGPIINGRLSYMIAARRSYLDIVKKLFIDNIITDPNNALRNTTYHLNDLYAKLYYTVNDNNRIELAGYQGGDFYKLNQRGIGFRNNLDWGNKAISASWQHRFSDRLSGQWSLGYTDYFFDLRANLKQVGFTLGTKVEDFNSQYRFTWLPNNNHTVKFGVEYTKHRIVPQHITLDLSDFNYNDFDVYHSHEWAAYLSENWKLSDKWAMAAGLRLSSFSHVGPFNKYATNQVGVVTDTLVLPKGQPIDDFYNLEPRLVLNYIFNPNTSIKTSFSRAAQYVNYISVGSVSLPTDIWYPSTAGSPPGISSQATLGIFKNFFGQDLETSIEAYYKLAENTKVLSSSIFNSFDIGRLEENLELGNLHSYGLEWFLKKNNGKLTGWLGYTLSKTSLTVKNINNGEPFPAKYDRTHDLSLVGSYKLNHRWSFSALFIYATGNSLTMPAGRMFIQGNVINDYTRPNSFRMPAYHRLDVSATSLLKKTDKYETRLNFSVYNVYSRANPYYIFFKVDGNIDEYRMSVKPVKIALFPILPSVSFSFNWY
ncbi:MAG: TonB-dependent receptor [Bacteroidales bacterium]|nr:TonB-dependent receptor [Bacteroidales bacterium]